MRPHGGKAEGNGLKIPSRTRTMSEFVGSNFTDLPV